jgi:hypothetical protein
VLVDNLPAEGEHAPAVHPVRVVVLEWATFIMATLAAVGSLVRVVMLKARGWQTL